MDLLRRTSQTPPQPGSVNIEPPPVFGTKLDGLARRTGESNVSTLMFGKVRGLCADRVHICACVQAWAAAAEARLHRTAMFYTMETQSPDTCIEIF